MSANKPNKFEKRDKELEQYGSWVKSSFDDIHISDDFSIAGDPENDLMTEEEEMLLNELEHSESRDDSTFGDISFDEFEDLEDELHDTFGDSSSSDILHIEDSESSDLSVKILQNIESELVGLRSEVKDLKNELSHLKSNKIDPVSVDLGSNDSAGGFFEDDDDETIALTGDELDNILVSADVEKQNADGEDFYIEDTDELTIDDLIITEENDDLPEEFNESNILEEDDLQKSDDMFPDLELDHPLMDDLTLGDEDPALAELSKTDSDLSEIESPIFGTEEFEGIDGDSFTVEEYTETSLDTPLETTATAKPEVMEHPPLNDQIDDDDTIFDEGEEVDISLEEDDDIKEIKSESVPFEDLEEIDLSSFDDSLVPEEAEKIEIKPSIIEDDFEDELTIEIEGDSEEITLEEMELPQIDDLIIDENDLSIDDIVLPEESMETPREQEVIDSLGETSDLVDEEIELPDLDDLEFEELDSQNIDLDELSEEIVLEEVTLDEDESLDLSDSAPISFDEIESEELTLDEINLDDQNEDVFDLPELDDIIIENNDNEPSDTSEEVHLKNEKDFPELDEIVLDNLDDEGIVFDELVLDEMESDLELPDLDDIVFDDQQQESNAIDANSDTSKEIIPEVDEIILEDINDEPISIDEIDLPNLDEIILEENDEATEEIPINDLVEEEEVTYSEDEPQEIILEDLENDTIADEIQLEESILSDIELPDDEFSLDDVNLDDDNLDEIIALDDDEDNIFGDDAENIDLDSLEQLAVEDSDSDLANEFSEKVEEMRDAALNGNVPEELKDEIKDILLYMDQLLESLPDEKIQEFARSEHFEVYKKIFEELGIKK